MPHPSIVVPIPMITELNNSVMESSTSITDGESTDNIFSYAILAKPTTPNPRMIVPMITLASTICLAFMSLANKITISYSEIKNTKSITIPLNTIPSIPRIHLVYIAAGNCVKKSFVTCGAVIPSCFCFATVIPDHNPQVISFYRGFDNV